MERNRGLEVPRVPALTGRVAEAVAERIIRDFDPSVLSEPRPFPVAPFYEYYLHKKYGLNTGVADLPVGVEGYTDANGVIRLAENVYEAMWRGAPRPRFTAVHEGMHGIRHLNVVKQLHCEITTGGSPKLYRRQEIPPWEDPEWQASRLAGAVLMPWATLETVIAKYGERADMVMPGIYNVSFRAAEVRLEQLVRMGWIRG